MLTSDWSDVPARIAALSASPQAGSVFGANDHRWLLEPPLSDAELAEVESQLGVGLPEEYRSFLLQAGRGGAGPAYGLFPLRRVGGRWGWDGDVADLTDPAVLREPFPYTAPFDPAAHLPEPPDEADHDTEELFAEAEAAYETQYAAAAEAVEQPAGLLYLCHLGCAYREALVVTGPGRGDMWADDTAGDNGFRPLRDRGGDAIGFAAWYRTWLETAEAGHADAAGLSASRTRTDMSRIRP